MKPKNVVVTSSTYFTPADALGPIEYIEPCSSIEHAIAVVPVKTYILPDISLTKSFTSEIVSELAEKNFYQFHAVLTSDRGRILTAITRLDHERDHSEVFYNIQLQINYIKSGKDTIAKVLVDKDLYETRCSNCQNVLVEIFEKTLLRSFDCSLSAHTSKTNRGKKEGVVFAMVKNSYLNCLDEKAKAKLGTIQLEG
jgi:hypothetical protein